MVKVQEEIAKEMEKTVIHKISVGGRSIEYRTSGVVPGNVLNQFSMDEDKGYFRVATTTGNWRSQTANNIYVLDDGLRIVGKLEDLASGERIYSVRFLGDKGYMVTFKRIDPLFVIDLSSPTNPKVLGELKIPGYSDYLHPYDDTHIIGVGKDVNESIDADKVHSPNAVYYTAVGGVKLSLFDVSDVSNPKEVSKIAIGDAGTDSEALRDHKSFLFNRGKGLLAMPIMLHEKSSGSSRYGGYQWQGAYIFNVSLENGFTFKGRITHAPSDASDTNYYYYGPYSVTRSLYIGDVLYTVSQKYVKMNGLDSLVELNKVELPTGTAVNAVEGNVGIGTVAVR
jgi:uncharacterized secreted protein with C-terminal beta-propeller domain